MDKKCAAAPRSEMKLRTVGTAAPGSGMRLRGAGGSLGTIQKDCVYGHSWRWNEAAAEVRSCCGG